MYQVLNIYSTLDSDCRDINDAHNRLSPISFGHSTTILHLTAWVISCCCAPEELICGQANLDR